MRDCRPAAAPSHPASGYVSSQQLCDRENWAANADVRSSGGAERRINRPVGVRTIEQAAPNAAQTNSSAGHRQPPIPAAVTAFPGESFVAPRSWAERGYQKLIYFHQAEAGGHFAAWEQPDIFSREVRDAFRPLRNAI